ncbi:unnamed protein product [Lota lota]
MSYLDRGAETQLLLGSLEPVLRRSMRETHRIASWFGQTLGERRPGRGPVNATRLMSSGCCASVFPFPFFQVPFPIITRDRSGNQHRAAAAAAAAATTAVYLRRPFSLLHLTRPCSTRGEARAAVLTNLITRRTEHPETAGGIPTPHARPLLQRLAAASSHGPVGNTLVARMLLLS